MLIVLSLIVALTATSLATDTDTPHELIHELTASNFKEKITNGGKNVFVQFYKEASAKSRDFKPTWEDVARMYEGHIMFAQVNCAEKENQRFCKKIDVKSYPTLKYFLTDQPNKARIYNAGLLKCELMRFIEDNMKTRCDVEDQENTCDAREKEFIKKFETKLKISSLQLKRLLKQIKEINPDTEVKLEKYIWMKKRIVILDQILPYPKEHDEHYDIAHDEL